MKKLITLAALFITCSMSYAQHGKFESLSVGNPLPSQVGQVSVNGIVYIQRGNSGETRKLKRELADKYLLWVEDGVLCEDLAIADQSIWLPDYVFESEYELPPLDQLETFVKENHHLPGIIGETELKEKGVYEVNDMVLGQLKNLEELTLHTINLEKQLKDQSLYIDAMMKKISTLEKELTDLEQLAEGIKD